MKSLRLFNNARGAVAPLVAIMLVVIILCVAVVVDLGHIHNVKVQLQRAVDAAALAGATKLPDEDAAVSAAEAMAAANRVDQDAVIIDPDADVILGTWDKEIIPGQTADDRFDETGTPPNAVKVMATRVVDHVFFFFLPSTAVTTDAIAIYEYKEETIPIALVSCIPTGGSSLNVASPGLSICDIATYRFSSDSEDTAAWTSLTFNPASNTNIRQFLTEEGRELFNEVIYGTGSSPEHHGIENTDVYTNDRVLPVPDVDTYDSGGCLTNSGTSISCGLGEDISLDPESITNIRVLDSSKVPSAAQTDPLAYDPLPRWYHFDNPASYDYLNDAFTRVWTQNGNLVADSDSALQTKLADLYFEITQPYGTADHRFKSFIDCQGSCSDAANRYSYTYKPNYNEVLRYAGYPPVWVNNGAIPPALDEFLERTVNDDSSNTFKSSLSKDNEPFKNGNEDHSGGSGYTVQLTLPVIFAGNCDDWAALAVGPPTNSINLYYVGTANFLITRCWRNPNCYEQESAPLTVKNWSPSDASPSGCSSSDFDPPLTAGDSFQCTGGPPGGTPNAALEGTIRPPIRGDESTAGIKKVYLVE